jgi:hypothetical protein
VNRIVVDGIRKQVPNPIEVNNIKLIKAQYYDIWRNFDKYSYFIKNKTNFQIIKFLTNWCIEQNIKNRNNIVFTHNQIKGLITTKQK